MGKRTATREVIREATVLHTRSGAPATERGEQHVKETGKLNPLVDPAEYGVVRPSRIRLEPREQGGFTVTVGTPVPIEYRLDTTGSMGDNVARALRALPDTCELVSAVLPGRDPFYCAGIFGDIAADRFGLCRGHFEALGERMVDQLTLMVPEGNGGDNAEDPHYGLFGAAYLTNAYLQRVGLRSYDFTITDAPAHDRLNAAYLRRVFGPEVFERAAENGYPINPRALPDNNELVADLLKRAHAFALLVASRTSSDTINYWREIYGQGHVVVMPQIEHLPHTMATIIGLTEGTFDLRDAAGFLTAANLSEATAQKVIDSLAHIPIGAQRALPNFARLPKKGDVFLSKTDLWPVDPSDLPGGDVEEEAVGSSADESGGWL